MTIERVFEGCYLSGKAPETGSMAKLLDKYNIKRVIGHPTYKNDNNIGDEIKRDITAAAKHFAGDPTAIIVSDGTWTEQSPDRSTMDAALKGAIETLGSLNKEARRNFIVICTPYDGYQNDHTPGKGSALKLIYEEVSRTREVSTLILLDGDLRNDFDPWFRVFKAVEKEHLSLRSGMGFFITARYARHFVDASLTRFVVGPLTTIMGTYVPGGISGDIVLSREAVNRECQMEWDDHRRRYGTDIATTFDNIADPQTLIYEVYLGAKLHDVTDEAKLSVMPGEVIGSALKRLLHYEEKESRITTVISEDKPVEKPIVWGPEKSGIEFIDPGCTNVFDVDVKRNSLIEKYEDYRPAMELVLLKESAARINRAYERLKKANIGDDDSAIFLGVDRPFWIELLYEHIAYLLKTGDVETVKTSMSYLYSAAFCEFCREKLEWLGARTLGQIRKIQKQLGVSPEKAKDFYTNEVDRVVEEMAMNFYAGRKRILEML